MKEIILDTETTGISVKEGHRIVEIGCIELKDLKLGTILVFFIVSSSIEELHCPFEKPCPGKSGAIALNPLLAKYLVC